MKSFWLPASLLLAVALHAEPSSFNLDGRTYQLDSATVAADGTLINEYYAADENSENWTTRVTVKQYPKMDAVGAAINPWLQSVRPQLTKKWSASRTPNATTDSDVIVEVWMMSAEPAAVEATLNRFCVEDENAGVKSYCFVEKLSANDSAATAEFNRKKFGRLEALGELKQPAVSEKK
jgi:hypothetical protein